jgi:hypothetical protein
MTLTIFLCIIVFLIGLYFYAKHSNPQYFESFTNTSSSGGYKCPNLLIQKGSQIYLYNSKVAQVPGANPIVFDNLEDYTEFLDWQRSQKIHCPVLYLQESYDAQGKRVYKSRPSITEPQGGLPPSVSGKNTQTSTPISNENNSITASCQALASYKKDNHSYKVSSNTNNNKTTKLSPDPMDPNWGGVRYTQCLVDKGYYKGDSLQ